MPLFADSTMRDPAHPLRLRTLHLKPTWHNRAGYVDRSACFELCASTIVRLAHADVFTVVKRRSVHAQGSLHAVAEYTITVRTLERIAQTQPARPLKGDLRTRKSNCMKSRYSPGDRPGEFATNPNRGATRLKAFGLPDGYHLETGKPLWSQTLIIQHWRYLLNRTIRTYHGRAKDFRTQHYLVCPTCKTRPHIKHAKLFLPLCTVEEIHDANLAQSFLLRQQRKRGKRNQPPDSFEIQLIERYAMLFHPRQFRCRHCLGIRYGEKRPSK